MPTATIELSVLLCCHPCWQAYVVLNLTADLRSEFSWNTKQLFVFVVRAAVCAAPLLSHFFWPTVRLVGWPPLVGLQATRLP